MVVWKWMWYCDKTAEWIRMSLELVVGVGLGIGVLNFGNRQREMGSFWRGKFGTSHCNQWDCLHEGQRRGSSQISLGRSCFVVLFGYYASYEQYRKFSMNFFKNRALKI